MYEIKKDDERYSIYGEGKLKAYGFLTVNDALHATWQLNGAIPNHFYNMQEDGSVTLNITPLSE